MMAMVSICFSSASKAWCFSFKSLVWPLSGIVGREDLIYLCNEHSPPFSSRCVCVHYAAFVVIKQTDNKVRPRGWYSAV